MHLVKAKGILSKHNGMNIYRGCTHGCIYCDSRSKCYQMNHSFEDIEVKINAPELLEQALKSKRYKCMIGTGAMSDPYIHLEEKLGLTRKCLEIINKYQHGLAIQTKSDRILRDLDLLKEINKHSRVIVQMTLTTFDDNLCKIIEPNVCPTSKRLETLKILKDNGIETVVWLSPFLPYINDNDENIISLLNAVKKVGVKGIFYYGSGLTLRDGNREYFYQKLDEHFPNLKDIYIKRFGNAYDISRSEVNERWNKIVYDFCKKNNILVGFDNMFKYISTYESKVKQLSIFDF